MKKNEILNIDKLRIVASIFWILGALITLEVALRDYNVDINNHN